MSASSKVLSNLKQNTIRYQKTAPIMNSSDLIKQNKARAVYSYTNNIKNLKISAGTTDETQIFNRVDTRCDTTPQQNSNGLVNLSIRNNNNVINLAKSQITPVVANRSVNELTDITATSLDSKKGASLCCNNNITNITTFREPCLQLEYLTKMNLSADKLPQLKEKPCCVKNYPPSQRPPKDTSCCNN